MHHVPLQSCAPCAKYCSIYMLTILHTRYDPCPRQTILWLPNMVACFTTPRVMLVKSGMLP